MSGIYKTELLEIEVENGFADSSFPLQNSVHSMKCRQTMLHVECRTINHFFRLDKRIKIEITSYSYNFEIVVYSFFDKNIFFSNNAKLKLKHFFFSFFLHGFRFFVGAKSYPNHTSIRCCQIGEHKSYLKCFLFA